VPSDSPTDMDQDAEGAPGSEPIGTSTAAPLCVFRVEETWLALDAHAVEAVTAVEACAPIPFVPEHVKGVVITGDRVLAVVDLALLMRLPRAAPRKADLGFGRCIVVHAREMRAGFLCDRAAGLIEVPVDSIAPVSVLQGARLTPFLKGEAETRLGLVGVLDAPALMDGAKVRG